ncbi:MAG: chemotaxis protein CheB [Lysobacteraceae bacterium]
MTNPASPPLVALLGRDDGARAQLRGALIEFGAQVVVEAEPAAARAAQVLEAGTTTVVVNLASGVDEDLEHLQELFDSPQVNVVFNEAEVSGALEGWDLARWARHLAAKVLGHDNTLPPPPAGAVPLTPDMSAELRPGAPLTPEQQTTSRPIEEFVAEAEFLVDDVPQNRLSLGNAAPPVAEPAVIEPEADFSFEFDLASLDNALQADRVAPATDSVTESVPETAESGLNFADFGLAPEPELPVQRKTNPEQTEQTQAELAQVEMEPVSEPVIEMEVAEDDFIELPDIDADSLDLLDESVALSEAPAETLAAEEADADFSFDLGDLAVESINFEEDATRTSAQVPSVSINFSSDGSDLDEGNLLDDDVAALAASLDALEKTLPEAPEVEDFSLSLVDTDDDESGVAVPVAAVREPAESSFGSLSLASLDDDVPATSEPLAEKPAARTFDTGNFGSLSLASLDDDAPAAQPVAAPKASAFGMNLGSGLSLEPVEGEGGNEVDPLMVAMGLVEAPPALPEPSADTPPALSRVVALGASIGGPDAVRNFLGALPENFPAVFLLVQHLENGYFERLAQQLQKSVKMPVSVLGEAKVQEGHVYVVPANARFSISQDGSVSAHAHEVPPHYTPSIDNLFVEVAERFGARVTAIIFSGMAGDAIEGATRITTAGGEVWVQDPSSCVVSSMVDGATARGVVEFTGSPRELADKLLIRYGRI